MRYHIQEMAKVVGILACLLTGASSGWGQGGERPAGGNTGAVAELVSKEGSVELAVPAPHYWIEISPGEKLHLGDQLRTGTNSRALVRFSDKETWRVGPDSQLQISPPPGRKRGFEAF